MKNLVLIGPKNEHWVSNLHIWKNSKSYKTYMSLTTIGIEAEIANSSLQFLSKNVDQLSSVKGGKLS